MQLLSNQLKIDNFVDDQNAIDFCEEFFKSGCPKYILGRNEWAKSIAEVIEVDGFVDDFTNEQKFLDKKIIKTQDLLQNAMVVSANVLGRPITVKQKLTVYHRHDDFWRIPELILSYRNDYKIFLRHYTEGVAETVMFFIPKNSDDVI